MSRAVITGGLSVRALIASPGRRGWVGRRNSSALCHRGTLAGGEYAGVPCRYHGRLEALGRRAFSQDAIP